MRRTERGFTLMELMVVIVIVAILAAVAVPLYINYVKDAQRTEAKGALGAVITAQQAFYQRYGHYTAAPNSLSVDLTDLSSKWNIAYTLTASSGSTFTAKIDGAGSNAGMSVQVQYTRGADPVWTEQ